MDSEVGELGQWVQFRNGKASPKRAASARFPVFGSNGEIGRADVFNVESEATVIGRVGSFCGSTWFSPGPAWVTDNAIIATANEGIEARFWHYALQALDLNRMSHGSGQPLLNQSILKQIPYNAPPRTERPAIAATLSALDDKIESNRRAAEIAQKLGDALFDNAAHVRRELSSIATITMGSSPKGRDLNELGDGLPFYQGTRDFGFRFPTLRIWTEAPVRTAAANDTLMSVRAPVGDLNRAKADCCIGRGVAAIHSDLHPSTIYYAMRNSASTWDRFQGDGTVFASVNKMDVHGSEIRWVRDDEASDLESGLRSIDARIDSLESESQRLAALRDALLPELLAGRIRVSAKEPA